MTDDGVSWDYVGTALREHHAIGTLDEHRTEGDTLSIRLQVPTVRQRTVDAVALSACDSAAWLFEHRSVDRITYTLDGERYPTDSDESRERGVTDSVSITALREWFDDDGTEPADRLIEQVDSDRSDSYQTI
jgi:hypothetical protein